jgi:hypothetical protein
VSFVLSIIPKSNGLPALGGSVVLRVPRSCVSLGALGGFQGEPENFRCGSESFDRFELGVKGELTLEELKLTVFKCLLFNVT